MTPHFEIPDKIKLITQTRDLDVNTVNKSSQLKLKPESNNFQVAKNCKFKTPPVTSYF